MNLIFTIYFPIGTTYTEASDIWWNKYRKIPLDMCFGWEDNIGRYTVEFYED